METDYLRTSGQVKKSVEYEAGFEICFSPLMTLIPSRNKKAAKSQVPLWFLVSHQPDLYNFVGTKYKDLTVINLITLLRYLIKF